LGLDHMCIRMIGWRCRHQRSQRNKSATKVIDKYRPLTDKRVITQSPLIDASSPHLAPTGGEGEYCDYVSVQVAIFPGQKIKEKATDRLIRNQCRLSGVDSRMSRSTVFVLSLFLFPPLRAGSRLPTHHPFCARRLNPLPLPRQSSPWISVTLAGLGYPSTPAGLWYSLVPSAQRNELIPNDLTSPNRVTFVIC
jgi:hypothetical protein